MASTRSNVPLLANSFELALGAPLHHGEPTLSQSYCWYEKGRVVARRRVR
jgi:hypothetical protein